MAHPDLNLLVTLDALLTEGSVAKAARRLRLSPSAMSRSLARLRKTMGDPLLVRAGRGLVATPRALELRERVGALLHDSEAVLRPAEKLSPAEIDRTFSIRTSEGFVENFGPSLIARIRTEAPGLRLFFLAKTEQDNAPLRDGMADLEIGVVAETTGPEIRTQALFRDRLVGAVRQGHALAKGRVTPARYAAGGHIAIARRGSGRVDEALSILGLKREIAVAVGGFSTALALARATDLVATVPERHTGNLRTGLHSFALPVATPPITVSMLWHPRLEADTAHRWLRGCLREVCAGRAKRA